MPGLWRLARVLLQVVAREHAATPPRRLALEGWSSARRFDGPIERSANDPTRAGRHFAVAAASPNLCAGLCSRDGGRGAPSRGVRGAVPCDQIGRWRAARGDELRLMDPLTPPAPSRWSLCAEARWLSPFGGPIDSWAKSPPSSLRKACSKSGRPSLTLQSLTIWSTVRPDN